MKPALAELGADLLTTSPRQRRLALVRPYLGMVAFATAAWMGWWWVTPVIMFGIFVARLWWWAWRRAPRDRGWLAAATTSPGSRGASTRFSPAPAWCRAG